jgi:hypothetical protein
MKSGEEDDILVRRVIRQHYPAFRACYEGPLALNANLRGHVTVRFSVLSDGSFAGLKKVASTLPDKAVVACVKDALEKLKAVALERNNVVAEAQLVFAPYE